jgi:hypothetical protein
MHASAGTPRSRLLAAAVIAAAALAALAVFGGTPPPAPAAIPADGGTTLTDSVTDGTTTDGTTSTTVLPTTGTTTVILINTLTVKVKGPGKVTVGGAACGETSINTPDSALPQTVCSRTFSQGSSTSFSLNAVKLLNDDANFVQWETDASTCNLSPAASCSVTVSDNRTITAVFEDNVAPIPTISSPAANQLVVAHSAAAGSVSAPLTWSSNPADPAVTAQCSLDGALVFSSCPGSVGGGDSSLSDATQHSVGLRLTDPSGNLSAMTRNYRVYVLDTTISGPTGTVSAPPTFELGSTKTGSTFVCSIDGGAPFGCPPSYTADLPDGPHTLAAQAVHAYDGTTRTDASPATRNFTIDRPDPVQVVTLPPPPPLVTTPVPTPRCTVPRLRGKTLRGAKTAITRAGCKVGAVTRKYSAKVRRGRVVGQRPRAGSKVARGTKVAVVLSRGRR